MLHAAAYCGLTEELSESNFLMPIAQKYGLLSVGEVYDEEYAELKAINIDQSGSRACAMFEVWAFEVLKGEALRYEMNATKKSTLAPPVHARLQGEINNIGVSIKRLFAYRYQVLPYIYTHLVSLSCALYLVSFAFLLGTRFSPEASVSFGLVFPLCYVIVQIVTTFGLIEVGETILDPFGSDPEDYALLHFVEVTVVASHEAIRIKPCGVRVKDREQFYDPGELFAANKIIRRLIQNHRWRKIVQEAKLQSAFKETMKKSRMGLDLPGPANRKGEKGKPAKGGPNVNKPGDNSQNGVNKPTIARGNSAKLSADTMDNVKRRKHRHRKSEHPGRVRSPDVGDLGRVRASPEDQDLAAEVGDLANSFHEADGALYVPADRVTCTPGVPIRHSQSSFMPVTFCSAGRTHSRSSSSLSCSQSVSPKQKVATPSVKDLKA